MRFPRFALTGLSAFAALVAISSVLAQSVPHKFGADKPMGDYLDMQAQSAPFRAYADAFGSRGCVCHMYIPAKTGELRPFVLHVVNDGGRTVVANVLTDHLVPDRHR